MAPLIKDPLTGAYTVKSGDTLSKIASTQGRTLAELLATNPQYASNPNLIRPGDVVKTGGNATAGFNLPDTSTGTPPTAMGGGTDSTSSLYGLLTKILMDNKTKAANQYTGNTTALLQGQENIGATNAGVYSQDMANANLTPQARLSLLGQAGGLQSPGLKSIENQMRMNEAHYNTAVDQYKAVQDAYNKEQDRILSAKQHAETLAASQNDPYKNYSAKLAVAQADDQKKIAQSFSEAPATMRDSQGYITPEVYRNAKARWIIAGYAGNDFDNIFNGVINPTKAQLYGIGFMTKVSSNDEGMENPFK